MGFQKGADGSPRFPKRSALHQSTFAGWDVSLVAEPSERPPEVPEGTAGIMLPTEPGDEVRR